MNWTGGRLPCARQSRTGGRAIINKQKQHFAKVRTRLQNGRLINPRTNPFVPDFLQDDDPLLVRPSLVEANLNHSNEKSRRQGILDDDEGQPPLTRRLNSLPAGPSSLLKLPEARSSSGPHRRQRRNTLKQQGAKRNNESREMPSFPIATAIACRTTCRPPSRKCVPANKSEETDEAILETRRKHLLQQPDWVGLGPGYPAAMSIASHPSRKYVGKRRRVHREIQFHTAMPPAGSMLPPPCAVHQQAESNPPYMMSGAIPIDDKCIRVRVGDAALQDSQATSIASIAAAPAEHLPPQSNRSLSEDTMILDEVIAGPGLLLPEHGNDKSTAISILEPAEYNPVQKHHTAAADDMRVCPKPKQGHHGMHKGTDTSTSTSPASLPFGGRTAIAQNISRNSLKQAGLAHSRYADTVFTDDGSLRLVKHGGHVVSDSAVAARLLSPLGARHIQARRQARREKIETEVKSIGGARYVEAETPMPLDAGLDVRFGGRLAGERENKEAEIPYGMEETEDRRRSAPAGLLSSRNLVVDTSTAGSGPAQSADHNPSAGERRRHRGTIGKLATAPSAAWENRGCSSLGRQSNASSDDGSGDSQRVYFLRVRPLPSFKFTALPSARGGVSATQAATDGGSARAPLNAPEPESSACITQSPSRSLRAILNRAEQPPVRNQKKTSKTIGSTEHADEAWVRFVLGGELTSDSELDAPEKDCRQMQIRAESSSRDVAGACSLRVEASRSSPAPFRPAAVTAKLAPGFSGDTTLFSRVHNVMHSASSQREQVEYQSPAPESSPARALLAPSHRPNKSVYSNPTSSVGSEATSPETTPRWETTRPHYGIEAAPRSATPATSRITHPHTNSGMPPVSATAGESVSGATARTSHDSVGAEADSPAGARLVFSRPRRFDGTSVAARRGTSTARAQSSAGDERSPASAGAASARPAEADRVGHREEAAVEPNAGPSPRRRPTLFLGRRAAGADGKGRSGRQRPARAKASPGVYDLPVSTSEDCIEDF